MNKELELIIGGRIKTVRERSGLNQSEFAGRIGISPSAIAQYEAGSKKPGTEVVLRIASEFSISTDYLLGCSAKPQIFSDGEGLDFLEAFSGLHPRDRSLVMNLVKVMRELP